MIHRLIGLVVVLAVIIIGLTMYLAPDDLAKCSGPGSGECATADAIVAAILMHELMKRFVYISNNGHHYSSCRVRQLTKLVCPMLRP